MYFEYSLLYDTAVHSSVRKVVVNKLLHFIKLHSVGLPNHCPVILSIVSQSNTTNGCFDEVFWD